MQRLQIRYDVAFHSFQLRSSDLKTVLENGFPTFAMVLLGATGDRTECNGFEYNIGVKRIFDTSLHMNFVFRMCARSVLSANKSHAQGVMLFLCVMFL